VGFEIQISNQMYLDLAHLVLYFLYTSLCSAKLETAHVPFTLQNKYTVSQFSATGLPIAFAKDARGRVLSLTYALGKADLKASGTTPLATELAEMVRSDKFSKNTVAKAGSLYADNGGDQYFASYPIALPTSEQTRECYHPDLVHPNENVTSFSFQCENPSDKKSDKSKHGVGLGKRLKEFARRVKQDRDEAKFREKFADAIEDGRVGQKSIGSLLILVSEQYNMSVVILHELQAVPEYRWYGEDEEEKQQGIMLWYDGGMLHLISAKLTPPPILEESFRSHVQRFDRQDVRSFLERFEQFVADIAKPNKVGTVQQDSDVDASAFLPAPKMCPIDGIRALRAVKTPGDGNCQFHAIARAFTFVAEHNAQRDFPAAQVPQGDFSAVSHTLLRELAADTVEKLDQDQGTMLIESYRLEKEYGQFTGKWNPDAITSVADIAKHMRVPGFGFMGDATTLAMLVRVLKVDLFIIRGGSLVYHIQDAEPNEDVIILNYTTYHYELVVAETEDGVYQTIFKRNHIQSLVNNPQLAMQCYNKLALPRLL
jgi:hypothetical protein